MWKRVELHIAKGKPNAKFSTPLLDNIPNRVEAVITKRKAAKPGDIVSDLVMTYG